ncbi:MAG TPA: hypothetical protein VK750_00575, partial [Cytophagaceae bacterium]|nr:hypothetical protein [Cytophagaceae bacterium]
MKTHKLIFTLLFLISGFYKSFAQPGTLDASFGKAGIKTFSAKLNTSFDKVTAVVLDQAGNTLVCGTDSLNNTSTNTQGFALRLLPNGTLDTSFAKGGKLRFDDLYQNWSFFPQSIATFNDGSMVFAGYRAYAGTQYPTLIRLNKDGSRNISFGSSASGYMDISSTNTTITSTAFLTSVQISTDQSLIFASGATSSDASGNFLMAAVNSSNGTQASYGGSPDGTFSYDFGIVAPTYDEVKCSALFGDKLYLVGNSANTVIAIVVWNLTTGSLESTFKGGGRTTLAIGGTGATINTAYAVSISPQDTSINIAGSATVSGAYNTLLYKIDKTGTSLYSQVYLPFGASQSQSYTVTTDINNKIVMGGGANIGSNYLWTVMRVNPADGSVDNSFGTSGVQTYSTILSQSLDESIRGIECRSDGSYILKGTVSSTGGNTDVLLKKVTLSGSPDLSYGTQSEAKNWVVDANTHVTNILQRSDSKLWVVGDYN